MPFHVFGFFLFCHALISYFWKNRTSEFSSLNIFNTVVSPQPYTDEYCLTVVFISVVLLIPEVPEMGKIRRQENIHTKESHHAIDL